MDVDGIKRIEPSKGKVTAVTDVDVNAGDKAKMNQAKAENIDNRPEDKNKNSLQGEFSESSTEKLSQNEGEKSIQTVGPEKSLLSANNETKDKSKILVLTHL